MQPFELQDKDFVIRTSRSPEEVSPFTLHSCMKRSPDCNLSSRMQAQATISSLAIARSSLTLSLRYAEVSKHPLSNFAERPVKRIHAFSNCLPSRRGKVSCEFIHSRMCLWLEVLQNLGTVMAEACMVRSSFGNLSVLPLSCCVTEEQTMITMTCIERLPPDSEKLCFAASARVDPQPSQ